MTGVALINLTKKIVKVILWLALVIGIITTVIIWKIADNVVHPPKRALQDYHHYWLDNGDSEGLSIAAYDCALGLMPCLFVTASPTATLGVNGQRIRTQLTQDFGHTLAPFTDDGQHLKGIVVLLHGRAGRKEDMLPIAARFVASGFGCVLVDMPAHGNSPLQSSQFGAELNQGEPNLIAQSLNDMRSWLRQQNMLDSAQSEQLPAYLWGMSMGGSYANYALADEVDKSTINQSNWQGIIIVSSFAHLQDLAQIQADHLMAPLPDALQGIIKPVLLKVLAVFVEWQGGTAPSDINPADVAGVHNLPVLQFHGDSDTLIDISQGQQLFDSYRSMDKTWVTVAGAGHNDVLITKAPVYATMADWLLNHSEKIEINNNTANNTQRDNVN